MATYTSNYAWTKPSGNDNVDISVLNANLDSQDSIIHDAFTNMAQAFSESSTYAVDDIVLYGTTTYKCHTAVTTAGSWTGSTNWQVYKLSEGGGGGLTLGETSSTAYRGDRGKVAYDHSQTTGNPHGTTKSDVGLGNVPNVTTNDQTPTFTEASTRNNIASGEKLSVILGKVQKFFNDLKTVAFSGSFTDLTDKPENANTFQGTIAEWNQLTTAEKKAYDHASILDSLDGNVTFPASKVMMLDGASVEADLASAVPRTKTGTTLATLNTALQALSNEQKSRATVCVNGIYWIRRGLSAVFASSTYIGSSGIYQMQLQIGSTPHFYNITHNYGTTTHTSTETAVTSWTLYYQGTPIS